MQNLQIVLTRENQSVPWGFRLKGGAEYNVPLSILKVNPGSPAESKLECADVVQSIGNYSALYLKHEEGLNIIRLFEYHLPLVIKREPVTQANPNASLFWSPSQMPDTKSAFAIERPGQQSNFNSSFQHNLTSGPAWPQYNEHQSQHQQQNQQIADVEPERDFRMDNDYKSQFNYQPIYQQTFPVGLQQDGAPPLVVPPALIRAMTGSSLGKKPFTYTPGGLDLSHIRESSRVKRYDNIGQPNHEVRPHEMQQQRAYTPSFVDENGDYQTYMSKDSVYMKNKLKPVHGNDQFGGVVSEHLVKPNKHRELINQSTSFRMLNRWINEAEQHPKQVEPEQRRHTEKILQESKVLRCLGSDNQMESGVDRTSYVKSNAPLSPYTRLLKMKAKVDKALGKKPQKHAINQKLAAPAQAPGLDTTDVNDKVPAGLRYQEREVMKFQGENIPSKTFKYLQYITQEELMLQDQERKERHHNQVQPAQQQQQQQQMAPIQQPPVVIASTPVVIVDETVYVEVTEEIIEPVVVVEDAPAEIEATEPIVEVESIIEVAPVVVAIVEETIIEATVVPEVVELILEAEPVVTVETAPETIAEVEVVSEPVVVEVVATPEVSVVEVPAVEEVVPVEATNIAEVAVPSTEQEVSEF